jgi:hypothetical protein
LPVPVIIRHLLAHHRFALRYLKRNELYWDLLHLVF